MSSTYLTYKNEIEGLRDVGETVKTTEKIAASRVHTLKTTVAALADYSALLEQAMARLAAHGRMPAHPLVQEHTQGARALVVATADKGLVSGLWHDVVTLATAQSAAYGAVIALGAKGRDGLAEEGVTVTTFFPGFEDTPTDEAITAFTQHVTDGFTSGRFKSVDIIYPHFRSVAQQQPQQMQLLPFRAALTGHDARAEGMPLFLPDHTRVATVLIAKYVNVFVQRILIEAKLSELAARTVAMEHAAAKTDQLLAARTVAFAKEHRRVATQRQMESFIAHRIHA